MTREIKFRAWNDPTKMMHFWTLEQLSTTDRRNVMPQFNAWMQFTGLKDKNGTPIYESDLVQMENNTVDEPWTVLWLENKYARVGHEAGPITGFGLYRKSDKYLLGEFDPTHLEVIGNIYENPELMEAKHEQQS